MYHSVYISIIFSFLSSTHLFPFLPWSLLCISISLPFISVSVYSPARPPVCLFVSLSSLFLSFLRLYLFLLFILAFYLHHNRHASVCVDIPKTFVPRIDFYSQSFIYACMVMPTKIFFAVALKSSICIFYQANHLQNIFSSLPVTPPSTAAGLYLKMERCWISQGESQD